MQGPLPTSIFSYEFFPPKTPEGMEKLIRTARALAVYEPQFFSVTYGAGGSTRDGTIQVVNALREATGVTVAPHLSCVGSSAEMILEVLNTYQEMGVDRIITLRGDLPSGMGHSGELRYASELVTLIRQETGDHFHITVAAYPEFHPQALSVADDILNLKRKFEAGANDAITQYFYNPDAYFYFLDDCAKHGIHQPIVPGIMPISQFSALARFSDSCGAEIPRWLRKRLESCGDDVEEIKKIGTDFVSHLCEMLLVGGAPGLHFYTLNQSDGVAKILSHLGIDIHAAEAK